MSSDRMSISGPQSSAGILGITANTNLGGIKFNPRGVVIFAALFVILVKVADVALTYLHH
jgi:preprotein translocase subunit Sec61beta